MRFKINFFSIMLFLSLCITEKEHIFFIISPAILHEMGHLAAARCRKVRVREMNVTIMGARMILNGCYSYTDEFIISFCGPIVNIIFAGISILYIKYLGITAAVSDFFTVSVSLAITNLLPIKSFDGGRMLQCILLKKAGIEISNSIISITSFITLFSLWSISIYYLLRFDSSLSLFIFSISLFADIFISKSI